MTPAVGEQVNWTYCTKTVFVVGSASQTYINIFQVWLVVPVMVADVFEVLVRVSLMFGKCRVGTG
jgi:hypothetical protein